MGEGDLMVSPVEAKFDIQMGESDHASGVKTVAISKPADSEDSETVASGIASARALGAAAAKAASSQSGQPPQAPGSSQPPARAKPKEPPVLPRVNSVIPAMFVPVDADTDLTAPFDPPRSRIERAKAMIETLGYFRNGVRQGFVYLGDLDRQRIVAEARERQASIEEAKKKVDDAEKAVKEAPGQPPTTKDTARGEAAGKAAATAKPKQPRPVPLNDDESVTPDEMDDMIAVMRAPAIPGVDYNMGPAFDQHPPPIQFPPVAGVVPGGRRDSVRQISDMIEKMLVQMSGYDAHMVKLRAHWLEVLEREQKLLDDQFGALPDRPSGAAAAQADNGGQSVGGTAAPAPATTETPDVTMSGT